MSEVVIQQLLTDAGATGLHTDLVTVDPSGLEVAAEWRTLQSPETYLGYRTQIGDWYERHNARRLTVTRKMVDQDHR